VKRKHFSVLCQRWGRCTVFNNIH